MYNVTLLLADWVYFDKSVPYMSTLHLIKFWSNLWPKKCPIWQLFLDNIHSWLCWRNQIWPRVTFRFCTVNPYKKIKSHKRLNFPVVILEQIFKNILEQNSYGITHYQFNNIRKLLSCSQPLFRIRRCRCTSWENSLQSSISWSYYNIFMIHT